MGRKVDWKGEEEKIMRFWLQKRDGYGLRMYQFSESEVLLNRIRLILRTLRIEGIVTYGKRRWFIQIGKYKKSRGKQ